MTPLDVELHDRHVAAAHMKHCTLETCRCPTCGVVEKLLRAALIAHNVSRRDRQRISVRANDFAGGSYPYLASVRVDGREIYRIVARPDECLAPDVIEDVLQAIRRTP